MDLKFAIKVLKKERENNPKLDLNKVEDKLQFLIALTKVEESLSNGDLTENGYIAVMDYL